MNTPKTIKRFSVESMSKSFNLVEGLPKSAAYVLNEPRFALEFARIVSMFEHLEREMATFLGHLLGNGDRNTAGYLLRSLKAPRARFDLMRDLLELAPQNEHRGREFDEVLAEYRAIAGQRNGYVHGLWFTGSDGAVALSVTDEHGWGYLTARVVALEEMEALRVRISQLVFRIVKLGMPPPEVSPPTPPLAEDAERPTARRAAPPPPPPPPEGSDQG